MKHPSINFLKNLLRPLVPRSVRARLREHRINRQMERWRELNLHTELDGFCIRVTSRSDWSVFNEIFVEGLYDGVILDTLRNSSAPNPLVVLDLGANVGFFALRFAQFVFRSAIPDRLFIIRCVEGSPKVYKDLCARVSENPRLNGHVSLHHGLVGRRFGTSEIYESSMGAGNSIVPQHWSKPTTVQFIDLDTLISETQEIDLIKCDIEGSEQLFQESYANLLVRTKLAVVEVHHEHIDGKLFDEGMRALGFGFREVLWSCERAKASLIAYSRKQYPVQGGVTMQTSSTA